MSFTWKKPLLTGAAGVCAAALVAGSVLANPYKEYEGTTLVVNFPAHPHYDAVAKVLPDFTKETGIEVEVDKLQYLRMHDKQVLEMSKPTGDYDLISYVIMWKTEYVSKDFLTPLAPFFVNAKLADPAYDAEDILKAYIEPVGLVGGKRGYLTGITSALYGIPFGSETSVLAYRKDIFDKHGLKVPETYDELLDLTCKIPELEPGMAGLTSRGAAGHQVVHAWLLHLSPYGGAIFDDFWKPIFDQEAGVKAAQALKKILECGPEGGTSFGFSEMKNAFLQGKAAMFLDSLSIAGEAQDPTKSKVAGKIAWAKHPKAVTRASQTGGFGIAIPQNSKNKEAAFLLLQWLTSKATDKKIALAGGSPSRLSTFQDPELQKKFPHYAVFADAFQYAAYDWRPLIAEWGELNAPTFGVALSEAMTGEKTIEEAFADVKPRVVEIMTKAGYYSWGR
ncbi:MAG: extracellular solute-binding protein [Rhodospirillales bacterium]|nr:extracellular solute-binding protein [Rhodospirillales bacterium]